MRFLILLIICFSPTLASASPLKKRVAHHIANRFVYTGGIATLRPGGQHGGVAGIGDRKVGKFYDIKVGDPIPSAKRFRLRGIHRDYVVIESDNYRVRVYMIHHVSRVRHPERGLSTR